MTLVLPILPPSPTRLFLGVERSATGRAWRDRIDERGSARALAIAQRHDLPELLARILAGRGVEVEEAAAFLDPTVRALMPEPLAVDAVRELLLAEAERQGAPAMGRALADPVPVSTQRSLGTAVSSGDPRAMATFADLVAVRYRKRKVPMEKIHEGLLAGAAIGYLCKHNATLSGAEGGCQSEIGVASAMSAAFIAQVMESSPQVIENAAESALEHHLGMTCDPVAGYVQVPCIERCAFGAVKAWIAFMIATNEVASRHRVDLDTTIKTLADTGRDMSAKYKETSEAGLAANLVLC